MIMLIQTTSRWNEDDTDKFHRKVVGMKRVLFVYILISLFATSVGSAEEKVPENYLTIGALDHKTGLSLIGYARTLVSNEKHELFVGAGTLIAAVTISSGWKYNFLHYYADFYSVVSVQAISAGQSKKIVYAPFLALGIEKKLSTKWYINAGVVHLIRLYIRDYDIYRPTEHMILPNLNFNRRW